MAASEDPVRLSDAIHVNEKRVKRSRPIALQLQNCKIAIMISNEMFISRLKTKQYFKKETIKIDIYMKYFNF